MWGYGVRSPKHRGGNELILECGGDLSTHIQIPTGMSMGPFFSVPMDPTMQLNSRQDWANCNMWGSAVVPFDTGTNVVVCGNQLTEHEHRGGKTEDLGGVLTIQAAQPSNKGKEIAKESNAKKGR